jgi:DNA modification methylase
MNTFLTALTKDTQIEQFEIPAKPTAKKRVRINTLNDLTGTEWIRETTSVWFQKGLGRDHPHAQIEREHPAPFSFQDIMRLVKFFTKANDMVIDPFAGVMSTLKACALTGRRGIGIELIDHWAELGERRLREELPSPRHTQTIIRGDARIELRKFSSELADYLVTSPPYWQILGKRPDHKMKKERLGNGFATKYSDDPRDLGNISDYHSFLDELAICFRECFRILKAQKYASVIVSDFRHNSTYTPYHADVIYMMNQIGFALKGITILVQNAKSVYPYGYANAYVPNIHHQYILNFQKGK